jgi:hypothetical protein
MRGYVGIWSFGTVLAILGVATVVGVGLAVVSHHLILAPLVLGAAVIVGIIFVLGTRWNPSTDAVLDELESSEPFDDPVEEADRLDSAGPPVAAPPSGDESPASTGLPTEEAVTQDDAGEGIDDDTPGYDPVEEADRLDRSTERPGSAGDDPK